VSQDYVTINRYHKRRLSPVKKLVPVCVKSGNLSIKNCRRMDQQLKGVDRFDGVSMKKSNFRSPGNLKMNFKTNNTIKFAYRDGLNWNGPFNFYD